MASADSPRDGLRSTIIISSDAEMDEHQPQARKLRRKRPRTDYSYPVYEALFDDPAPSEMRQPPKKRKIPNLPNLGTVLETANQGIHNIFEAEHAKRKALEEEVQHLRAEITRKNGLVDRLETEELLQYRGTNASLKPHTQSCNWDTSKSSPDISTSSTGLAEGRPR
ncbi:predicted protein [Histoplasma mississippiense (nom. inval.)]|uniref:predicted protein n=1 Tax=Ajellomyces capsulatus (strain NAm1 / WU24) TaxID=2059318 RepID=UPI000157BE54|nr:predicted protein [Histoplasma mississippiense (nom. inval.)]EDN06455.1 predicted protein [Histoplasma mississippiense (nom. inval.)]